MGGRDGEQAGPAGGGKQRKRGRKRGQRGSPPSAHPPGTACGRSAAAAAAAGRHSTGAGGGVRLGGGTEVKGKEQVISRGRTPPSAWCGTRGEAGKLQCAVRDASRCAVAMCCAVPCRAASLVDTLQAAASPSGGAGAIPPSPGSKTCATRASPPRGSWTGAQLPSAAGTAGTARIAARKLLSPAACTQSRHRDCSSTQPLQFTLCPAVWHSLDTSQLPG